MICFAVGGRTIPGIPWPIVYSVLELLNNIKTRAQRLQTIRGYSYYRGYSFYSISSL